MLAGVLLTLAGCGGDGDPSEPEPNTREPQSEDVQSERSEDKPAAATSDRECLELWNSEVQPGTVGQKSTSDFVAEIASKHRVPALARYVKGQCLVVVPFKPGAKGAWVFVATDGRAPFHHPSQVRRKPGQRFAANARTKPDGTLE
jgi:hypothetical protein